MTVCHQHASIQQQQRWSFPVWPSIFRCQLSHAQHGWWRTNCYDMDFFTYWKLHFASLLYNNKNPNNGRYCGRNNSGKITSGYLFLKWISYIHYCNLGDKVVSSNRVLIRFSSGPYKPEGFARKGFIAELSTSASIFPSLFYN